jgi:23S rRNA (adenine2503-C2)-methyltransferase
MQLAARNVHELREHIARLGARPVHARRLLSDWLAGRPLGASLLSSSSPPARGLLEALPELQVALDELIVELERHPSGDGAIRRLVRLRSGRTVECVDLPREGLCVSTQVGCAVGCRFCKTGESGLLAQLSALEILAQVALARRERAVRRVVFMGMGEPAHNLEAVLDALAALGDEGRFAHKNLVFSTVGEPAVFQTLLEHCVRPGLALSLHTLDGALRSELLPRAPRVAPEELLAAALSYADRTTYPLLVQWTLLEGVNDSLAEARQLASLLRGRRALVNYIPFNAVDGAPFQRPPIERSVELVRLLKSERTFATLRRSAGAEVEGACGQLRARRAAAAEA